MKQFNTLHCNLTRLENNNIQFTTHASIYQFSCHHYFVLILLLSDSIPFLPIPFPHLASHIFLNQLANGNSVYESTDAAHTCLLFVVICFTTAAPWQHCTITLSFKSGLRGFWWIKLELISSISRIKNKII